MSSSYYFILYEEDLSNFDVNLYGETNTTYIITYRAKIVEYDDRNDYDELENTVTFDYDLEIPYTLTLDLSELSHSNQSRFQANTSKIVFSDNLNQDSYYDLAYFIDSDETITLTTSEIAELLYSTETKLEYNYLREFLRNLTFTIGNTTYSNSSVMYILMMGTLTISKYEWTFTIENITNNAPIYNFLNLCYQADGIIKINYNAIQNSNSNESYQKALNKATCTITVSDKELTYEDTVSLYAIDTKKFTVSKRNLDSLTLGEDTYEYTKDNNIGWLVNYYGTGKLYKGDKIIITDTLPDNVNYVDGEYVAFLGSSGINGSLTSYSTKSYASLSDSYGTMSIDYDEDKNIITFTIDITASSISYNYLYIYFQTEINEDYYESMQNNGNLYDFVNSVTLNKNGTEKTTSATKTIDTTESTTITKDSSIEINYSESDITADFTITVNPNGKNYVSAEGDLTITDTMPSSFVLDETSVKAINVNTSEEIEIETEYDKENNKIYFSVPDETYVKITYSVTVDIDILENPFWYKDTTNTATISNGRYSGNKASSTAATEESFVKVWATLDTGEISIYKYKFDNGTEASLSGATFTLYSVYDNMENTETKEIGSATVDEDGNATFTELPLDRIYKLVETGVPDGYVQADDYYFILEGNDGVTIPESLSEYTINELESGNTISIVNYEGTTVEVSKEWNEDSDFVETYRPNSITITLYRTISESEEKETVGEYEITAENDWKLTINNIRKFDDDGNTYIYSIEENEVTGYNNSIVENEENTGVFVITNTFETTSISGTKTWIDENSNERPESISIVLYANGEQYTTHEYNVIWSDTDKDVWNYSIEDLPMYSTDGEKIVYTVVEESVENYTTTYSEDTLDIINTYKEETEITEEKEDEEYGEDETEETKENQISEENSSKEEESTSSSSTSSKSDDSTGSTSSKTSITTSNPKTNDEIIIFVIIGIVAVTVLVLNILYNKLTDDKEKDNTKKK